MAIVTATPEVLERPLPARRVSPNVYLLLILAVALLARLGLLLSVWGNDSASLGADSYSYMEPAKNLLTTGQFWRGDQSTGQPEIMRTPGYPLFMLLCGLGTNDWYGGTQIAQVALGVVIVLLAYVLGSSLVSRTAGLWAAGLQAVSVGCIMTSIWILSECLFSLLLAVILILFIRYFQPGSPWAIALAAVLTATAIYVRPIGIVFVPIALTMLLWRRAWRPATVFGAIVAAMIAPWCIRNHAVGYDGFSSVGDQNLLWYEAPGVSAAVEKIPVRQARKQLEDLHAGRIKALGYKPDSGAAMKLGGEMAKRIILAHPLVWARMHAITSFASLLPASTGLLQSLGVTTGSKGTMAVLQSEGPLAAAKNYFGDDLRPLLLIVPELIYLAIQYGLGLVFAVVALRRYGLNWSPAGWLMVLTVIAFIFVTGPGGVPRYRVPIEPLLNVAAAGGLMYFVGRRRDAARLPAIERCLD